MIDQSKAFIQIMWSVSTNQSLVMVTHGEEERGHCAQDEHGQLWFREARAWASLRLVPRGRWVAVTSTGDLGEDVDCGHVEKCPGREEHGQTRGGDGVRTPGSSPDKKN